MDLFLYLDRDTPIHRLDPRTKILLTLLSFAMALMFRDIPVLLGVTALVLFVGALGRALPNLGRIRGVLIMIALFCLTIWPLARGEFSLSGVLYGAMIALKTDLMIVAGHTVAQERKKRWSWLNPLISATVPWFLRYIWSASKAIFTPPRSAIFSPLVKVPFTKIPFTGSYLSN